MKTQMRFQKILAIISIIIAALGVAYALIFCSGTIAQITYLARLGTFSNATEQAKMLDLNTQAQGFSDLFLTLGIVYVVIIALLFITATHSRRKYYWTNYIAIGIAVIYMCVFAVIMLVDVINVQNVYNSLDLAAIKDFYATASVTSKLGEWEGGQTWTLSIGYALFVMIIINVVALVLNLVWKILLMRGEKKLLASSVPAQEVNAEEVA